MTATLPPPALDAVSCQTQAAAAARPVIIECLVATAVIAAYMHVEPEMPRVALATAIAYVAWMVGTAIRGVAHVALARRRGLAATTPIRLRAGWRRIALASVAGLGVAFLLAFDSAPLYEARGIVVMRPPPGALPNDRVLSGAWNVLRVETIPGWPHDRGSRAIERLRQGTRITVEGDRLITTAFTSPDAEFAARAANSSAEALIKDTLAPPVPFSDDLVRVLKSRVASIEQAYPDAVHRWQAGGAGTATAESPGQSERAAHAAYDAALASLAEIELARPTARVQEGIFFLERAKPPSLPRGPSLPRSLGVGFAVGLSLGLVLAVGRPRTTRSRP